MGAKPEVRSEVGDNKIFYVSFPKES